MVNPKKQLLISIGILAIISLWFFFISTNVNPVLGNIYNNMAVLTIGIIIADFIWGKNTIKLINKNVRWGTVFMWGLGGYIAILFSTQLTGFLSELIPLTEILSSLASTAPVFSNSPIINFLTFADFVAYLETFALFVALLDLMGSIFNIPLNRRNIQDPRLWGIILSIATIFLFFHITAKGIENETTLILVFIMAVVSMFVTVWTQDARPALLIHILANTIASTAIFSIIPLLNLVLVGG